MSVWEACRPLLFLVVGGALVLLAVTGRRRVNDKRREELAHDPLAEIFCDKEEP